MVDYKSCSQTVSVLEDSDFNTYKSRISNKNIRCYKNGYIPVNENFD